jgi:hypothetical protein
METERQERERAEAARMQALVQQLMEALPKHTERVLRDGEWAAGARLWLPPATDCAFHPRAEMQKTVVPAACRASAQTLQVLFAKVRACAALSSWRVLGRR